MAVSTLLPAAKVRLLHGALNPRSSMEPVDNLFLALRLRVGRPAKFERFKLLLESWLKDLFRPLLLFRRK